MVDPDSSRVIVTVTDGHGRRIPDRGLARWLAGVLPLRLRGEVAIALVTDSHIRRLNRQYRGLDYATDVLSFEPGGDQEFSAPRGAPRAPHSFGDIVIATGVAQRQARQAGHAYRTELRVLALHGFLHLLGYDHDDPGDHGRMGRAEARLRRRGGLPAGLIARADGRRTTGRALERSGRSTHLPDTGSRSGAPKANAKKPQTRAAGAGAATPRPRT